jgi:hypothetical protein
MGIRIDRYEEEKEEVQDMQEQEDNRIYEIGEKQDEGEYRGDQEEEHTEEHTEEEENNHEEDEEEYYRENDNEEENQNYQNNCEEIENEELKDFFDDIGEFETLDNDDSECLEEDEEEIEKFVGDAKDTILFFMCMWLFLLSLKYPGDFMIKLEFVNEFIDKRERQIKRMVDKIDRVLRRYAKIYKMLVEFGDWTFIMDIMILTMTFQAELEEKLGDMQEQEGKQEKEEEQNTIENIGIELQNNRITALIGGTV